MSKKYDKSGRTMDKAISLKPTKREREKDISSKMLGSPLKIRKVIHDVKEVIDTSCDIVFDDWDDSGGKILEEVNVVDLTDDKKNSAVETRSYSKASSKSTNSSEHLDENDSVLLSSIFSQFSDSDSENSACTLTKSTATSSKFSEKTQDSGVMTLEAEVDDDFTDCFDEWDEEKKYDLDLEDFRRVKIVNIERERAVTRLTVEEPDSPASAVVLCSEVWRDVKLKINEFATIKAKRSGISDWRINNEFGFVVTQPDTLVSGTAVVNSFFCNRKGIFQSKFTGMNALPNLDPNDSCLTLGTIVHELLQSALSTNIFEIDELRKRFEEILKTPTIMLMLYGSQLTYPAIRSMVEEYICMIHEFMYRYVRGRVPQQKDSNFNGRIVSVKDIEESVCLPSLGLKGKIDATVEVELNNMFKTRKIMPLEIKTGKSSFSIGHKGQLYLYCMLLNILGTKVDSGLLLYIKDNMMQEMKSTRNEQRDLIMLRNTMAYYLSRDPVRNVEEDPEKPQKTMWEPMELPDPIYHTAACKNCVYNTVCCVYADQDMNLSLSDNHPIRQLSTILLAELKDSHINYVMNWIAMLEMEQAFDRDSASSRRIWESKPIVREKKHLCLSHLVVTDVKKTHDGFIHRFVRSENPEHLKNLEKQADSSVTFPIKDFTEIFTEDDIVMINTDTRINLADGHIIKLSKDEIEVDLQKDITQWNCPGSFHVDFYPQTSRTNRVLGTVVTLLADNDITRRLRKIVIDKEPATFTGELPDIFDSEKARKIRKGLNKFQEKALEAVIKADDYVLIKGMPGTGKTHLIVAMIEMLVLMGKSVLVTAHTHTAVNNILLKLLDKDVDFLRIGTSLRSHPLLLHKTDGPFLKDCETPEMLEAKFNKMNVVGVTCTGSSHALLSRRIFDYCIVDECTQALQPILLRPLFNAAKIVLIGDPKQLPAVVRSSEARKCGMAEDIFNRLDSPNNTRVLSLQYRMNKNIMNLANELTYNGELRAGNKSVANATIILKNPSAVSNSVEWVQKTLSCKLEDSVVMLNTGPTYTHANDKKLRGENEDTKPQVEIPGEEKLANGVQDGEKSRKVDEESQCCNISEAFIILKLVNVLIESGIAMNDIGIIAPYRAQINLLRKTIKRDIEINTVDQYQGRDKSVIFVSFAKSVPEYLNKMKRATTYEILEDHKRLNVALTRAKHKLIIIGDVSSLQRFTPVQKLLGILGSKVTHLKEGVDNFSWQDLFSKTSRESK